jgi:hypothetical protein
MGIARKPNGFCSNSKRNGTLPSAAPYFAIPSSTDSAFSIAPVSTVICA